MQGYLGRADLTASAMRDGWYITGDIATLDEDGFLTITDRLSRFSKIGGEMVPHGRVEEALQQAAGADMQVFAVTGIPDERKGEQLAVLHTLDESQIPGIVAKLTATGLPNLYIPPRTNFIKSTPCRCWGLVRWTCVVSNGLRWSDFRLVKGEA